MTRIPAILALTAALAAAPAFGTADEETVNAYSNQFESVDKFHFFGRLNGWRAVDKNSLIVWTTPFKPYLIELRRPAWGLNFAHAIGLSSVGGTVHAKLDTVYVDGFRYPIKSIHKLTKEDAKRFKG